ncbi:MAG: type II toxin-antitoxin system RelE/ParE family toxin [Pseudomonadota bacterium]
MGSDEIILLISASQDLDIGEEFYDKKRKGLGQYFLQSLFADLEALKIYAGIHPKTPTNSLYMTRAKRFPYMIYYRVMDRVVHVIAILPTRQSSSWASELLNQRAPN